MSEFFDRADRVKLLEAILRQTMDDYIKLQHPKFRSKKYLEEAFQHSADMLFDSEFRLLNIKNDNDEDMSLLDLVREVTESHEPDMLNLKHKIVKDAQSFWETKQINTLYIPDSLIVDGHVYSVLHTEETPRIDHESKFIYTNKDIKNSESQEVFMVLVMELLIYHEGTQISKAAAIRLSKAMFRLLRMNSCFTGDY